MGKRQPGAERVKPQLKWAMAHFPGDTKQRLLSLIIPLTSSRMPHHFPLLTPAAWFAQAAKTHMPRPAVAGDCTSATGQQLSNSALLLFSQKSPNEKNQCSEKQCKKYYLQYEIKCL